MAESESKRTFRVKNFTGEGEDEWRVWSSKMLAFAHKKGYHDALTKTLDLSVEENEKANREAISDLTIVCEGEAWEIMHDVETEDASAYEKWEALKQAFHPEEIDDYVDLTNEFKLCKMENEYEDPKIWIRKLTAINRRLGAINDKHKHDNVQMIAEIFLKLPLCYSEFVTGCNLRGASTGTVAAMVKDLTRFYKRTIKSQVGEKNKGQKQAFIAIGRCPNYDNKERFVNYSKFKGLCNKCGKQGHKALDCRVKPENYTKANPSKGGNYFKTSNGHFKTNNKVFSDKSNLTCWNCQKKGHVARDCKEPKANQGMFIGNMDYYFEDLASYDSEYEEGEVTDFSSANGQNECGSEYSDAPYADPFEEKDDNVYCTLYEDYDLLEYELAYQEELAEYARIQHQYDADVEQDERKPPAIPHHKWIMRYNKALLGTTSDDSSNEEEECEEDMCLSARRSQTLDVIMKNIKRDRSKLSSVEDEDSSSEYSNREVLMAIGDSITEASIKKLKTTESEVEAKKNFGELREHWGAYYSLESGLPIKTKEDSEMDICSSSDSSELFKSVLDVAEWVNEIDQRMSKEEKHLNWVTLRTNADWPLDHVFWYELMQNEQQALDEEKDEKDLYDSLGY
jgi:hypothetical protein